MNKIFCTVCLNIMDNFYEAMDEIFNNMQSDEMLELKCKIITAYEQTAENRARYLCRLIKPKSFRITEDGRVVRVE